MEDRDLARILGWMRVGFGAALLLSPRRAARTWTGERASDLVSRLAIRGMGGRDIAVGVGLLAALENDTSLRPWLEASALCDGADAFGTLAGWGDFPKGRALMFLAGEVAAVYLALRLAQTLD